MFLNFSLNCIDLAELESYHQYLDLSAIYYHYFAFSLKGITEVIAKVITEGIVEGTNEVMETSWTYSGNDQC